MLTDPRVPILTTTLHYYGPYTEDILEGKADVCHGETSLLLASTLGYFRNVLVLALEVSYPSTPFSPRKPRQLLTNALNAHLCLLWAWRSLSQPHPKDRCLPWHVNSLKLILKGFHGMEEPKTLGSALLSSPSCLWGCKYSTEMWLRDRKDRTWGGVRASIFCPLLIFLSFSWRSTYFLLLDISFGGKFHCLVVDSLVRKVNPPIAASTYSALTSVA